MKLIYSIVTVFLLAVCSQAQQDSIYNDDSVQYLPVGMNVATYGPIIAEGKVVDRERVNPPFWWIGMAHSSLEIMIYAQNVQYNDVHISARNGVHLKNVYKVQNPNYLFVEIEIDSNALAGYFDILLTSKDSTKIIKYELKDRGNSPKGKVGLNASDLIYLIMPDRFANGDTLNDSFDEMRQSGIHRGKMYFRHGGDLQGVIDHLDYLDNLGVTAIWLNPVQENDQPYASYHGYAITDHYRIDRRFGDNELYKTLVRKCHEKGMKVVMDIVFNHVGHKHWFLQDIPSEDWVHQWTEYTKTNYRSSILFDNHASKADSIKLLNGWFDYSMPDLNQKNARLVNYFIQNSIWWVQYSGLDAFRIDTWFYADQDFLSTWSKRMQTEFPNIGMFGESMAQMLPIQASFAQHNNVTNKFDPYLIGITDFQLNYAIDEALTNPQSWTGGIAKVYYTIAQDYLYGDPLKNVIFLDNHDKTRFFSTISEDMDKYKSGIAFLLTMRGIPSLYYGTELLFSGVSDPDGKVRQDFPGGWKEDSVNLFLPKYRTSAQNEAFEYVKKIAQYRKKTPTLSNGKLLHFVPVDGIYVYFRYDDHKTIMIIMNTNDMPKEVLTTRFNEILTPFAKAKNIVTDEILEHINTIAVAGNSTLILELIK